eukprot:14096555-Ditylum_brightwellii.AAC.1
MATHRHLYRGWGTTWFHPNGITNILALHEAKDKWRITYGSKGNNTLKIQKSDRIVLFNKSDNVLYYHSISNRSVTVPEEVLEQGEHIMFVSTANGNKQMFSYGQIVNVEEARKFYAMVGRPSEAAIINM